MRKSNNEIINHYKNLSNYWDAADGTDGIDELEDVEIVADPNIQSFAFLRLCVILIKKQSSNKITIRLHHAKSCNPV